LFGNLHQEELKARDEQIKKLEERAKASDTAAAKLAERLATETRTRIFAEERAFVEALVKEGKLAPAAGIPELLVALRELPESQTVTFAEADQAEVAKRPYDLLRAHLAGLKKVVELAEVAGGDDGKPKPSPLPVPKGAVVEDADLAAKARAFVEEEKKAGRTLAFADALDADEPVTVRVCGLTRAVASAAISKGALVKPAASGKCAASGDLVATTTQGDYCLGIALTDAAGDGSTFSLLISPHLYAPAA